MYRIHPSPLPGLLIATLLPFASFAAPEPIPSDAKFDQLILLARAAYNSHDYRRADALYRKAIQGREASAAPGDERLARSLYELGAVCEVEGRSSESSNMFLRLIANLEAASPAGTADLADAWSALGRSYYVRHLYAKAEQAYQHALDLETASSPPRKPRLALILSGLGGVYQGEGKYLEAEAALERGVAALAGGQDNSPEAATLCNNLGALYRSQGRAAQSEAAYRRGLAILGRIRKPDGIIATYLMSNLAVTRFGRGDYSGAAEWFGKAEALIEQGSPADPDFRASLLRSYAICLKKLHRKQEAQELEAKARNLDNSVPEDPESDQVVDVSELAAHR